MTTKSPASRKSAASPSGIRASAARSRRPTTAQANAQALDRLAEPKPQPTDAQLAQTAASPEWPDPPKDAKSPLVAKTPRAPRALRRKTSMMVNTADAVAASAAAQNLLSHVPSPKTVKGAKPPKLKKPKPVRDSFTMPKGEYQLIDLLKQRAAARQRHVKKSEILRAGILALANMTDAQLFAALDHVPIIKTGRPRQEDSQ